MATTYQAKLTKKEARAIIKHLREWFDSHPEDKTVLTRLGAFGDRRFHRERFAAQVSNLL